MEVGNFLRSIALLSLAFPMACSAATLYVDLNSTNASTPFMDWSTAATNIQDAIDVASPGDLILVTNGVYQTGGRLVGGVLPTNRVAVTQPLTVQSVNGPDVTMIAGYQVPGTTNGASAVRCISMSAGSSLIGFTLTNGATDATLGHGGGVAFAHKTSTMSNCIVTGNSAGQGGGGATGPGMAINCTFSNNWARQYGGATYLCVLVGCVLKGNSAGLDGGGAEEGVLTNCVLAGNWARDSGGGSYGAKLVNCTVTGNWLTTTNFTLGGGGVGNSSLVANCIVYFNTAQQGPNYADSPTAYSCTFPPIAGAGNITNAPQFVDAANGDYHLQSNSPCINAGKSSYMKNGNDLDGNPRIVGGTIDMGVFEFQSPASLLSYAWAQQYGLSTDGSEDFTESDGDGMNNWQEWIAGTDPTDPTSALRMFSPSNSAPGVRISWQSVTGKSYYVLRGTDLTAAPMLIPFQSNIVGQAGTTGYTDASATNAGPYFYRVGVQ